MNVNVVSQLDAPGFSKKLWIAGYNEKMFCSVSPPTMVVGCNSDYIEIGWNLNNYSTINPTHDLVEIEEYSASRGVRLPGRISYIFQIKE